MRNFHVALTELQGLGKKWGPAAAPADALESLEVVAKKRVDLFARALTRSPISKHASKKRLRGARRTYSMMVTVLLGLFVGVGWIRTPLPMKIVSNSGYSMISSIRMLFDEPWNLHFSLLHSFFRLHVCDATRV